MRRSASGGQQGSATPPTRRRCGRRLGRRRRPWRRRASVTTRAPRGRPCAPAATSRSLPVCSTSSATTSSPFDDRVIGLDLSEVAIDGSVHKAPYDGEGTGAKPPVTGAYRARSGHQRRPPRHPDRLVDRRAPIATTCACCYPKIRRLLTDAGLGDHIIQPRRQQNDQPKLLTLGLRWAVEAANSWLSNYGQLRRSTDRRTATATPRSVWPPRSSDRPALWSRSPPVPWPDRPTCRHRPP